MGPTANIKLPPSASFFPVNSSLASRHQPKNEIPRSRWQPKAAAEGVICLDDDSSCSEAEGERNVLRRKTDRNTMKAHPKPRDGSEGSQAAWTAGEDNRGPAERTSSAAPDEARRPVEAAVPCKDTSSPREDRGLGADGHQRGVKGAPGLGLERRVKRERGAADDSTRAGQLKGSCSFEGRGERGPTAGIGGRAGTQRGYRWPRATWTAAGGGFVHENTEGDEEEEDSEDEGSETRIGGHSVELDDAGIEVVDLEEEREGDEGDDVDYGDWEDGQVEDDVDNDSEHADEDAEHVNTMEYEHCEPPREPQSREVRREGAFRAARSGPREEIELSDDEEDGDVVCGQEEEMKREWEEAARKRRNQAAHSQQGNTSLAAGGPAGKSSGQEEGGVAGQQAGVGGGQGGQPDYQAADANRGKQQRHQHQQEQQQQQEEEQQQQQQQKQQQWQQHQQKQQQWLHPEQLQRQDNLRHQQRHPQQQWPQSASSQVVGQPPVTAGRAHERVPPVSSAASEASRGHQSPQEVGHGGEGGRCDDDGTAAADVSSIQADGSQRQTMGGGGESDAMRGEQDAVYAMRTAATDSAEGCAASDPERGQAGAEELQREVVRQSQEFRQADEDEWRERQRELDRQVRMRRPGGWTHILGSEG